MFTFRSLENFEPTRATLHNYANVIGIVPRVHGISHPKWWHISLKVGVDHLTTDNIPLPNGGVLTLQLNFASHEVIIKTSQGEHLSQSMAAGLTGSEMGDWVIKTIATYGLGGSYARNKFESDDERPYDKAEAANFFEMLTAVDNIFKTHKATLTGELGPIQLWPHGFDLAFEWFGTRQVEYEEGGETHASPAQLNLGFYPGGDPYFYSNPFPFATKPLLSHDLPPGASWHTDGWEGSELPYSELIGDPNGAKRLLQYAKAVYKVAKPTLMSDK